MNEHATSAAMGVAAVVLAWAIYETIKKPAQAGASGAARIAPADPGGGFTSIAPGEYLSTDQLIYGASTGSPYDSYATTDQLINGTVYGNKQSVVKVPGVWW